MMKKHILYFGLMIVCISASQGQATINTYSYRWTEKGMDRSNWAFTFDSVRIEIKDTLPIGSSIYWYDSLGNEHTNGRNKTSVGFKICTRTGDHNSNGSSVLTNIVVKDSNGNITHKGASDISYSDNIYEFYNFGSIQGLPSVIYQCSDDIRGFSPYPEINLSNFTKVNWYRDGTLYETTRGKKSEYSVAEKSGTYTAVLCSKCGDSVQLASASIYYYDPPKVDTIIGPSIVYVDRKSSQTVDVKYQFYGSGYDRFDWGYTGVSNKITAGLNNQVTLTFDASSTSGDLNLYMYSTYCKNKEFFKKIIVKDISQMKIQELEQRNIQINSLITDNQISISGVISSPLIAQLYNIEGKLISETTFNPYENANWILPENISSGIYIVKISNGAASFCKKIVKQDR